MGARATWICARATRRVARASDVCKGHIFCGPCTYFLLTGGPCISCCGPCTKLYCVSLVWPLHTSEALAPLLVALAHIQVALAPNSICQICGPCTWPLHLFSWPLHRPLPQKNEPFRPSKRYSFLLIEPRVPSDFPELDFLWSRPSV